LKANQQCCGEMGRRGVKSLSPAVGSGLQISSDLGLAKSKPADRKSAGTSGVLEAPVLIGGPSRTRTLDPLIKSDPQSISTEVHDDVWLEDLYTWD
jgi:hypothetical protein